MKTQINAVYQQFGAALPVALVMLLISTMAGLASIHSATEQVKMSSNMYDRSMAYQAAEAALVAAENAIKSAATTGNKEFGVNCLSANDIRILATDEGVLAPCPAIPADTFKHSNSDWKTSIIVSNNNLKPQYYIERIGLTNSSGNYDPFEAARSAQEENYGHKNVDEESSIVLIYRITARSGIPSSDKNRSIVVLQITAISSI